MSVKHEDLEQVRQLWIKVTPDVTLILRIFKGGFSTAEEKQN